MFREILSSVNWIDILIGCIVARGVYIGEKKGAVVELFKLCGMLFGTFIILHYYMRFAQSLHKMTAIPIAVNRFLSFIFLWLIVVVVFKIIREGWMVIFKPKDPSTASKWGGAFLAFVRSSLVCGLMFLLIFASGNEYLRTKARNSFTGFYLADFSPSIYEFIYNGVISRLFPEEQKNNDVFRLKDRPKEKK